MSWHLQDSWAQHDKDLKEVIFLGRKIEQKHLMGEPYGISSLEMERAEATREMVFTKAREGFFKNLVRKNAENQGVELDENGELVFDGRGLA